MRDKCMPDVFDVFAEFVGAFRWGPASPISSPNVGLKPPPERLRTNLLRSPPIPVDPLPRPLGYSFGLLYNARVKKRPQFVYLLVGALTCWSCGHSAGEGKSTDDGTSGAGTETETETETETATETETVGPRSTAGVTSGSSGGGTATTTGTTTSATGGSTGGPPLGPQIALGGRHTCLLDDGLLCWGRNEDGQLGLGDTLDRGDDEPASSSFKVDLPAEIVAVGLGQFHTCALTADDDVYCWGRGDDGRLGYASSMTIGDDELPAEAGPVSVGGGVVQLAVSGTRSCALLAGGGVRCWGSGILGHGNFDIIGDNETPASAGDVPLGEPASRIAVGSGQICAILENGSVTCWGQGIYGELGYGNTDDIGDDETPAEVGPVQLTGPAEDLVAGNGHTCALLQDGGVQCWGSGGNGALGYGTTDHVGDDETPQDVGVVDIGGPALAITAGDRHTCAIRSDGEVLCWGNGFHGKLGHGDTQTVGDNEAVLSAAPVQIGSEPAVLAAGGGHTCAVTMPGDVLCWGLGRFGQLGYGNTPAACGAGGTMDCALDPLCCVGDDEAPVDAGSVPTG